MSERILSTFAKAKAEGRPVFVPFVTAGFPTQQATVPLLLALEQGGADLIELGIPHTDPLADGPTIQEASSGTPTTQIPANRFLHFLFSHSFIQSGLIYICN
jgi:tryptophan synthase